MKIREISEHYCIVVRRIKKLISRNFFWKIEIIFKIESTIDVQIEIIQGIGFVNAKLQWN